MFKINNYLLKTSFKYIFINQLIVLFLVIFLNLIELSRLIEGESKNFLNFIYLSFLKIPTIINETSPFVIIISIAFLFRYLITNNELIAMRNIGFSIFNIFLPIMISVFLYGAVILFTLNPLASNFETKYEKILNKKSENKYSINFSENGLWIKNKKLNGGIYFINIEEFDIKKMKAKNIKILSIDKKNNEFFISKIGLIDDRKFILNKVNYFNILNDSFEFKEMLILNLNFSKLNVLNSITNFKNIPFYNYFNHIKTLKKFNLYSPTISLYYLSEILKPLFLIMLAFVVMGFSGKYKRNENFFTVLFYAVLIGFTFYIFREIVNKFTLSFNINFIYSYILIFIIPFLVGLYKVIQIEND